VRSASALTGGLLRELGEVAVPASVRRSRLFQSLVDSTLRFLIEQVGQVEGAYTEGTALPSDFLARRTAGNGIEFAGVIAFRASPVWVMAALADLSGTGRHLIREISAALKKEGLLDPDTQFETVDQMLDGLEATSALLAESFNTPPLDVRTLRQEWRALQEQAKRIPPKNLPSIQMLEAQWRDLQSTAVAENRSVLEISGLMALSAIRNIPANALWLSRCAQHAVKRTGELMAIHLLVHYRDALVEIRNTGFLSYWSKEFRPYLQAAARQFSPHKESLTQQLLGRVRPGDTRRD